MGLESKERLVAIIEDDESYRAAVQRLLKSVGIPVRSFDSAEAFLDSGKQHETGCLISDIRMPGMSGLELQSKLNSDHCSIPDHLYHRPRRRTTSNAGNARWRGEVPHETF